MNAQHDVVITGLGAITPSGQNPEALWESVHTGTSAIDVLAGEQFENLAVRIGGQIRDFDAEALLPRALARRLDPVQHWAIAAAEQALTHADVPAPGRPAVAFRRR